MNQSQRIRRRMLLFPLAICWACQIVPTYGQGRSKMYWSDRGANTVRRANLDGTNVETLVSGLGQARGVAVDLQNHQIYWADNGQDNIQRSMLDGSRVEELVTGLNFPAGIALDVANNRMYWADNSNRIIQRANLDGTNVETIISDGLGGPYYVTLELSQGHLYWTDQSTKKIQRSDLEGGNIVDLVTDLSLPRGIDVDTKNNMMYWADRTADVVQRSDLNGDNIETLHSASPSRAAPHGVALDVEAGHVYWVDNGLVTLKRMNLDGSEVTTILDRESGFLSLPWQIVLDIREPFAVCPLDQVDCENIPGLEIDRVTIDLASGANDPANDYNQDGSVTNVDRDFVINFVLNSLPGDSNLDGIFDSGDLVRVLTAGEYEDGVAGNSTWATGDWNGDLEFTSADLVAGLQAGYQRDATELVPEPARLIWQALVLGSLAARRRNQRKR